MLRLSSIASTIAVCWSAACSNGVIQQSPSVEGVPAHSYAGIATSPPPAPNRIVDENQHVPVASSETKKASNDDPPRTLLHNLPSGESQRQALCSRGGNTVVHRVFCQPKPPSINSLKDLQNALGLRLDQSANRAGGVLGLGGGTGFAFTGGSSSLVARSTSAINPRLVAFTQGNTTDYVAIGFARGEQFAEIVARDPSAIGEDQMRFFLVKFDQACSSAPGGCNFGDLLTPAIESGWTGVTLYEDRDLENTILDCKQCHQPQGSGTGKILRMQERTNPWLHWMRASTPNGIALLQDYQLAHSADETYAGVPGNLISASDPRQLETFVELNGFTRQPNEFVSVAVLLGGKNAWEPLYQESVSGRQIAPPYHQNKVTDPTKLARAAAAYKSVMSGQNPTASLPDIRDIFADNGLRDMNFMVREGLDGNGILTQACSQCHNDRLNQNISRAKFKIHVATMPCSERQKAITRLALPDSDVRKMPPPRFKSLTQDEISRVTEVLKCN